MKGNCIGCIHFKKLVSANRVLCQRTDLSNFLSINLYEVPNKGCELKKTQADVERLRAERGKEIARKNEKFLYGKLEKKEKRKRRSKK